jgi:hypothetical protein
MALEMQQLGYDLEDLRVLRGGSLAWEDAGYPMVGSGSE